MNATFSFVIGLLTTALSLLGFVDAHPELPQASRDQAQQVAEQAITQATKTLSDTPTPTGSGFTISYPTSETILIPGQEVTLKWSIPDSVIASFPSDFQIGLFLNVVKKDAPEINVFGINDGTNDPRAGSVTWKVPADISTGTYRIEGYFSAQPKDSNRLCATTVGIKDCAPSEADRNVMKRAAQYKDESDWFNVKSATTGSLSVSSTTGMSPFTVTFSIQQSAGGQYIDFGDGTNSCAVSDAAGCDAPAFPKTFTHTYTKPGTYTVTASRHLPSTTLGTATITVR